MSRQVRAYRFLIRMYPRAFRMDYEEQLVGLFRDQLRDAHEAHASASVVRLWARTLGDLVATAATQHLRKEATVLQPVEPPDFSSQPNRSPMVRTAVVVAAVPLVLWIGLLILTPGYLALIVATPPAILGLPAGLLVTAFAGGMTVFGWLVARHTRSRTIAIGALVFLTTPALVLLLITPALLLWVSDMP